MTKRRKRHTPEQIVRKLQTADRMTAEGATGDEVARHLGVSTATLYNWRSRYGAMDVNEAKELRRPRSERTNDARPCRSISSLWLLCHQLDRGTVGRTRQKRIRARSAVGCRRSLKLPSCAR